MNKDLVAFCIYKIRNQIFTHKIQNFKLSQYSQSANNLLNMINQFRIGNCNFSLSSCRWKSVNLRQKSSDAQYPHQRSFTSKIPNIRLHQTAVLLSDHVYMFGGMPQQQRETFCVINLKNNRWHQLKLQSTPENRDSHGMAILKKEIYLFGGSNGGRYFSDLYSFNNFANQWKSIQNKGTMVPTARDPMVFISVKNQFLLLIGGVNLLTEDRYLEDAFMWKNGEWIGLNVIGYPKGLIMAKAVSVNGRTFLFGGFNRVTDEYSSTLFEILVDQQACSVHLKQVALTLPVSPRGRVNHCLMGINNQYFLLICGQQLGSSTLKDMWVFDTFLHKWTLISPANGPLKAMHSFSCVMFNNTVYLLGGLIQNRINEQVFTIQFANQQIFKSQICENCVNIMEKKEQDSKKFPKDLAISVGFLYNMALEIRFPFHALSMIYEASKYFQATEFRVRMEKTLNQFNYLKIEFDGVSFGRQQFHSFISHNFISKQLKTFTQNIKMGSFRLGKTFLVVTSDARYRYTYLMSAESRISPHFDETYIYYSYIENLELQRIETEEGTKQRQFILNMLRQHITCPEIVLESRQKTLLLIFEPKVMMSSVEKEYLGELEGTEDDIRVWKNEKKVKFLEERGFRIYDDVEISLSKWMMFYRIDSKTITMPSFYINDCEEPVPLIPYREILKKFLQKGVIHKVQLPTDTQIPIKGELFITTHPYFLQHNYGLLIYSQSRLYSRLGTQFGRLFPQHFYKSKYKKATTIFYQLGYINVETGLDQNYFKNGFNKTERFNSLVEKIREKCDEKRQQIIDQEGHQQDQEEDKVAKKVKL